MDPLTIAAVTSAAAAATSTIADLAARINSIDNAINKAAPSLTQYARQTNIMGRVYIEDSIAQDDIAIPLMGALNQMYLCMIITALGIDSKCADGRTVRDRLALVAGESLDTSILANINECFGTTTTKPIASTEAQVVNTDPDTQRLVCGRLIELDFNAAGSVSAALLKAHLFVQLVPYILQQQVCAGFMNINFAQSLSSRWKALRAGEISFVKDFILGRDQVEKAGKMLKNDNTGVIAEMMTRQRNKLFRWAAGMTGILPERHNLAAAIMVLNKQTFDQTCREAHVDFNSFLSREKFFIKTFSMMMVVVDPMYGTVKMYFAGNPAVGTYSYQMINKVGAKNKDAFDLKEVMTAFSQGQAPRF